MSLPHEFSPDLPADAERKPAVILQHRSSPVKLDAPPMPDDICVCGSKRDHHRTINGNWIGCEGAKEYDRLPRDPQRWNDPRPHVTVAVRRSLLTKCGPAMDSFLKTLTNDEQLAIAHEAGEAAIRAYIKGLGK